RESIDQPETGAVVVRAGRVEGRAVKAAVRPHRERAFRAVSVAARSEGIHERRFAAGAIEADDRAAGVQRALGKGEVEEAVGRFGERAADADAIELADRVDQLGLAIVFQAEDRTLALAAAPARGAVDLA